MARPRIDPFWIDHIRVLTAENPEWSATKIRRELERTERKERTGKRVPSDRACRRCIAEFPEELRAPYKRFRWPESMEAGALPWESARACLDLLQRYRECGLGTPLIQECRWFWYVTQSAPAMSMDDRIAVTAMWVAAQVSERIAVHTTSKQHTANVREVEAALAEQRIPRNLMFETRPGIYVMGTLVRLMSKPKGGPRGS
jgi:hypothetical protein